MTVVDDIKSRLDIVDVVSGYASLQRSGRNFKACCPFHPERTPSFYVDPERQSWRCFGACATGGDVFGFVMKAENLEFKDALPRLARQAGVALPSRERQSESAELLRLNDTAREYFQQYLASSMGADARNYLEQRGISRESVGKFELGLSPRDGQSLFNHLAKGGFSPELMARAGAVYQNQDRNYRDAFRGRLIIPIRNGAGELAGFGSRALDDSMPKYLNTGRTPVFDKSRILYGLYLAREAAREQGIVIVEGYMDAITAHQHGFANVVASMGTALTEHQVAEIRRVTNSVTMALDADAAGQQATLRSLESSWQVFQSRRVGQAGGTSIFQRSENLDLKVAVLTQGKDPDEVIRQSPESWEKLVSQGVPLFDYLLPAVSAQIDVSTPEGKARVVDLVRPFIYAVGEPIRQDSYVRTLAEHLAIREETLQAALRRGGPPPRERRNGRQRPDAQSMPAAETPRRDQVDSSAFAAEVRDPLEEYFLALLLQYPDLTAELTDWGSMIPEFFKRTENKEIYLQLTKSHSGISELSVSEAGLTDRIRSQLLPELAQQLDVLLTRNLPPTEPWFRKEEVRKVINTLERRHLKELKQAEQSRFSEDPAAAFLAEIPEEAVAETLNLNRRIKANQESRENNPQNAIRGR